MAMSYKTRRRLSLVLLLVWLPLYIVAAVTIMNWIDRPPLWLELAIYIGLGFVWASAKALAAYGRRLKPASSRFDRYVEALESGDAIAAAAAMSAREIEGLRLFVGERAQCIRCHNGPLLSNGSFHNIGLAMRGASGVDVGRAAGVRDVLTDPFNCLGDFSDAQAEQCAELNFMRTSGEELPGAFKVPTLRDVDRTAPYMHDGRFATLEAVLAQYANPPVDVLGHQELETAPLSAAEIAALAAFLRALSGEAAPDAAPQLSRDPG